MVPGPAHPTGVWVVANPLPTAGDNPDGLSTATAAKGAFPMAPGFQPWITRIAHNYRQRAWSP
jgi:hypothetical protein